MLAKQKGLTKLKREETALRI